MADTRLGPTSDCLACIPAYTPPSHRSAHRKLTPRSPRAAPSRAMAMEMMDPGGGEFDPRPDLRCAVASARAQHMRLVVNAMPTSPANPSSAQPWAAHAPRSKERRVPATHCPCDAARYLHEACTLAEERGARELGDRKRAAPRVVDPDDHRVVDVPEVGAHRHPDQVVARDGVGAAVLDPRVAPRPVCGEPCRAGSCSPRPAHNAPHGDAHRESARQPAVCVRRR